MTRKPEVKSASENAAPRTRPVTTLRLGRIKAAIWENKGEGRSFYNVTFSRFYTDDEGKFHDSDSYGRDDLPLVAKLADEAHSFIFRRLASNGTERE